MGSRDSKIVNNFIKDTELEDTKPKFKARVPDSRSRAFSFIPAASGTWHQHLCSDEQGRGVWRSSERLPHMFSLICGI
jgi:hypothetical protein